MAELRDAGALGFTDDGKPVVAAGMLRRALQYQRLCGGVLALHEEDPVALRRRRHARGRGLARGSGWRASRRSRESTMVARDAAIAGYEDGARPLPAPLLRRVGRGASRWPRRPASRVSGEATPHHLTLTDEAVRSLDTRFKMNPPLRAEARPPGADRGAARRRDRLRRDRPRAARARREGGPVRAGADGDDRAGDRVRGALHRPRAARRARRSALLVERMTAGGALFGLPTPRIAVGEPANLCARRPRRELGGRRARLREPLGELLLRTAASCSGRVLLTVAAGVGRLPRARRSRWSRAVSAR